MGYDLRKKMFIDEEKNNYNNHFDCYREEVPSPRSRRHHKNRFSPKQKTASILFMIIVISALSGFFIGYKVGIANTGNANSLKTEDSDKGEKTNQDNTADTTTTDNSPISQE